MSKERSLVISSFLSQPSSSDKSLTTPTSALHPILQLDDDKPYGVTYHDTTTTLSDGCHRMCRYIGWIGSTRIMQRHHHHTVGALSTYMPPTISNIYEYVL